MSTQDDRLVAASTAHRRVAVRGTQGRQGIVWDGMEVGNDGGDYRLTGS
jgi:hypothetical protein